MIYLLISGVFVASILWGLAVSRADVQIHAARPRPIRLSEVAGVDRAALERCTVSVRRLGFEPFIECELPHLQSKAQRRYFGVFRSPDGTRLATVNVMFVSSRCLTYLSIDTWLEGDKVLVTTNGPGLDVAVVFLGPDLARVVLSDSAEAGELLAVHDARIRDLSAAGRSAVPVDDLETFGRLVSRQYDRQISHSLANGLLRKRGDHAVRTLSFDARLAAAIFTPLVPGRSRWWHAGLVAISLLAAASAAFGSGPHWDGMALTAFLVFVAALHGVPYVVLAGAVAALVSGPSFDDGLFAFGGLFALGPAIFLGGVSRAKIMRALPLMARRAGLLAAGLVAASCASGSVLGAANRQIHILPAGYRGPVAALYDSPAAPPAPRRGFVREYRVPPSGTLRVREPAGSTRRLSRRFSFYMETMSPRSPIRLDPLRAPPNEVRVCHLSMRRLASGTMLATYFVGDEAACRDACAAIEKHVWAPAKAKTDDTP